ncbi:hypothetical protein bcgnr5371_53830 [Bacillus cereus]
MVNTFYKKISHPVKTLKTRFKNPYSLSSFFTLIHISYPITLSRFLTNENSKFYVIIVIIGEW